MYSYLFLAEIYLYAVIAWTAPIEGFGTKIG